MRSTLPAFLLTAFAAAQSPEPALLSALQARSIGPAGMSGRVTAIAAWPKDPHIVYVGAATGGLWKSTDGALTFTPVFDDQDCASIGAIAIDRRSPDLVWVGTGEGNPRNSVSVGRGVYRSRDGGRTWQHLGLGHTERIRRIVLHPDDPDTAFVAALGTSWGENEQRGVFRTTDGGATWEKILFVDTKTGCANLVMDPANPDKLFANMWDHRRWPWFFRSGGPGSGLFRTLDGGETWTGLTPEDGLPEDDLGRIGLAIAPSDPDVVYALVEAEKSELLRSDDGGFTFRTVNDDEGIAPRPFYYADLRVDSEDPDRVINMHTTVTVSEDGGRTFGTLIPYREIHPDHHAMWIHPRNAELIYEGNDGGVSVSRDGGATWRYVPNLPLGQYYHLAVDDALPYHVYGGMQDNGSWRGPSAVWENGGIRNHHWEEVCFGDGFATLPVPSVPLQGYAMSQGGNLRRWDLRTGERKDIRPTGPDDVELRFNWNAAIAQGPFDPDTIYYGSQFVHRSRDRGDHWETISPDLTTDFAGWQKQEESGGLTYDVTGAENHTSILTIAPSPVQEGVVWAGTDDGRLHVTRDGGESWRSVEDRLPGVPRNTWIPHVEAGKFDPGVAFVVLDDHRRANWTPYVYRTDDFGGTWRSLATGEIDGYCLCLEQDPVDEDLLFLGTEFGLWFSTDGGGSWAKWTHGFPTVGTRALVVQPTRHDLVIGTHGRSAYVIDDIRPLRTVGEVVDDRVHVFPPPEAVMYTVKQTGPPRFAGATEFRGENRRRGAMITFWASGDDLPAPGGEGGETTEADVEIVDGNGDVVRNLEVDVARGLNRFVWRFERNGRERPRRGGSRRDPDDPPPGGIPVLPGTYTVKVTVGEASSSQEVTVVADPRDDVTDEARRANWEARRAAEELTARLAAVTDRLADIADSLDAVRARIGKLGDDEKDEAVEALEQAAKDAGKALDGLNDRIWGDREGQGIRRGDSIAGDVMRPARSLDSSWDAPTGPQQDHLRRAREALEDLADEVDAFLTGPVQSFNDALEASALSWTADTSPIAR